MSELKSLEEASVPIRGHQPTDLRDWVNNWEIMQFEK
jgi:hypothetical protein